MRIIKNFFTSPEHGIASSKNNAERALWQLEVGTNNMLNGLIHEFGPDIGKDHAQPVEAKPAPQPDNVDDLDEHRRRRLNRVAPAVMDAAALEDQQHEAKIYYLEDYAKQVAAEGPQIVQPNMEQADEYSA